MNAEQMIECEDCQKLTPVAELCTMCDCCVSSCCAVGGELCKCGGHLEGDELDLGVCCDCYPAETGDEEPHVKKQRLDSDEEEDSD